MERRTRRRKKKNVPPPPNEMCSTSSPTGWCHCHHDTTSASCRAEPRSVGALDRTPLPVGSLAMASEKSTMYMSALSHSLHRAGGAGGGSLLRLFLCKTPKPKNAHQLWNSSHCEPDLCRSCRVERCGNPGPTRGATAIRSVIRRWCRRPRANLSRARPGVAPCTCMLAATPRAWHWRDQSPFDPALP